MIITEHFTNSCCPQVNSQKPAKKLSAKQLKENKKAEICLTCTKASCKKGYCEIMKNNR